LSSFFAAALFVFAGVVVFSLIHVANFLVQENRQGLCAMKLSGQRWSDKGAQNMLNLRVLTMNNQWDKVVHRIKNAA
jgi:hypothetical protein